ncbi:hypothetical protein N2152v2_005560 [Parachlorella kessleri]
MAGSVLCSDFHGINATILGAIVFDGFSPGYVGFSDMNHYGPADFIASSPDGQVPPCALPAMTDPRGWATTKERQEAGIDLIASLVDVAVKGMLQKDSKWLELKEQIAASPRVQEHSLVQSNVSILLVIFFM